MRTDFDGSVCGLKILVSAVQFRPWPLEEAPF
jgi:hypothetical protein